MGKLIRTYLFSSISMLLAPAIVSAHEVYVLDEATIARDVAAQSPNPFQMVWVQPDQFVLYGIIGVILVSTVFAMSLSHWLQNKVNPLLNRLKPLAAPIARITLGTCLIASAYNSALFGPELPLSHFGDLANLLQITLYATGIAALLGLLTRLAGIAALLVFVAAIVRYDIYMLTYANYLGEILFAIILGSGRFSLDHLLGIRIGIFHSMERRFERFAFPLLRVLFGISIIYAPYYAKYVHSQLALDVVSQYHLTAFFPFQPLFIVLGAFIVEMLIGLFIIFGFEIRHTALFFLFWIFLSLLYFGEAVWPHLVLVGVLVALFCHGYDHLSIEGYIFKRHKREPVL